MAPALSDSELAELRDVLQGLAAGQGGPLPHALLVRLAGLTERGTALTVDFRASAVLGAPVVVLRPSEGPRDPAFDALTPREREVAGLVATGLRNRDIALALGISVPTVKDHVHRILTRTGLDSRAAVAAAWHGG